MTVASGTTKDEKGTIFFRSNSAKGRAKFLGYTVGALSNRETQPFICTQAAHEIFSGAAPLCPLASFLGYWERYRGLRAADSLKEKSGNQRSRRHKSTVERRERPTPFSSLLRLEFLNLTLTRRTPISFYKHWRT